MFSSGRRRRRRLRTDPEAVLPKIERLATFLDASIVIPGTRFRFGADAILGLFPGGGDIVGAALSGGIVYIGWQLGLPPRALARMAANILMDTAVGAVPVAGDVFDAWFKANLRNVAIIREHMRCRPPAP
jgi:hypothetical protein